jgi:hypothetical protein
MFDNGNNDNDIVIDIDISDNVNNIMSDSLVRGSSK